MASGTTSGFKRFLLWDYPRASWQYDVMVALILVFIFATPRELFRDQPKASNITRISSEHGGASVFYVDPDLLNSIPESQRTSRLEQMLKSRYGKRESVYRLEPIFGSEQELTGYMVWTKP